MSLLPILACSIDPAKVGVISLSSEGDRHYYSWNEAALLEHFRNCYLCTSLRNAIFRAEGARGGRASRGTAKRRGNSAYYRALPRRKNLTKHNLEEIPQGVAKKNDLA
jgi:hypothetical protein